MAYIKAISYYTPPFILDNEKLQELLPNCDVAKIGKGIGVSERHIAEESVTAGDMAVEAAKIMFKKYDIKPADIDFIIMATQSPDYHLPSTACIIQDRLGIPTTAGAFDFDLGCSGYVYGLAIADSFIESGLAKNVLLLTGDTLTRYMHEADNNRVLFGEAASATIISSDGFAKIGKFEKGTDGKGAEILIVKTGGARSMKAKGFHDQDEEGNTRYDDCFYMNGNAVFNFTIDKVPSLVESTIAINQLTRDDVDCYVFHQANKFMLNTIRKVCGIAKDKFYVNVEHTGNTTSSTVPIALCQCLESGAIHSEMNVMIAGFGVGLSWAGTILRFS